MPSVAQSIPDMPRFEGWFSATLPNEAAVFDWFEQHAGMIVFIDAQFSFDHTGDYGRVLEQCYGDPLPSPLVVQDVNWTLARDSDWSDNLDCRTSIRVGLLNGRTLPLSSGGTGALATKLRGFFLIQAVAGSNSSITYLLTEERATLGTRVRYFNSPKSDG